MKERKILQRYLTTKIDDKTNKLQIGTARIRGKRLRGVKSGVKHAVEWR